MGYSLSPHNIRGTPRSRCLLWNHHKEKGHWTFLKTFVSSNESYHPEQGGETNNTPLLQETTPTFGRAHKCFTTRPLHGFNLSRNIRMDAEDSSFSSSSSSKEKVFLSASQHVTSSPGQPQWMEKKSGDMPIKTAQLHHPKNLVQVRNVCALRSEGTQRTRNRRYGTETFWHLIFFECLTCVLVYWYIIIKCILDWHNDLAG